jgi:hypothetical protein
MTKILATATSVSTGKFVLFISITNLILYSGNEGTKMRAEIEIYSDPGESI